MNTKPIADTKTDVLQSISFCYNNSNKILIWEEYTKKDVIIRVYVCNDKKLITQK